MDFHHKNVNRSKVCDFILDRYQIILAKKLFFFIPEYSWRKLKSIVLLGALEDCVSGFNVFTLGKFKQSGPDKHSWCHDEKAEVCHNFSAKMCFQTVQRHSSVFKSKTNNTIAKNFNIKLEKLTQITCLNNENWSIFHKI